MTAKLFVKSTVFAAMLIGALGLNAAEYSVTEGSYTVPADATKVTKTGDGTVSLDAASTAKNVQFDVKEGTLVVPTGTLRLGIGTPLVYVDGGATLWCSNLSVQKSGSNVQMNLHLSGTVKLSPSGSYAKAKATTLESDSATAIVEGNNSGMWETGHTLDMQQHPFNINGYGIRYNNNYNELGGYFIIGKIYNNGDFNLGENAELIFYGDNVSYYGTTTTKTITIGDKAEVMFTAKRKDGSRTSVKKAIPYGLVANGDAYVTSDSYKGDTSGNFKGANTFLGAVRLNKDSVLTAYTRYNENMLFAAGVDGAGTLKKTGTASLFVTGNVESVVNKTTISRGTLALDDGMNFSATNGPNYIHYTTTTLDTFTSLSRLYVGKDSSFVAKDSGQILRVGYDADSYGMVDVVGGVVSNYLSLGNSGSGHLRVSGGEFYWQGTKESSGQQFAKTANSYSTITITNGTVRFSTQSGFTVNGSTTVTIAKDAHFFPNYSCNYKSGYNNVYIAGEFYDQYSIYTGDDSTTDGDGFVMTLDGDNASYGGNAFWLSRSSGSSANVKYTTQANLNGGVFKPLNFSRYTNPAGRKDRLFLTANGGTYQHSSAGEYFGNVINKGVTNYWAPDKIVVYPKGITFDANIAENYQKKVKVSTPINAPTGKGVKSVTLPSEITSRTDYPGPAKLQITSTRGEGFTAICEYEPNFDPNDNKQYGHITGVKVTCPGWDYVDATDVTVRVFYPMSTTSEVCSVELADNCVTGGLTKVGTGYLELTASSNTYGGVTYIQEGVLDVAANSSLPPATPIRAAHNTKLCLRSNHTLNTLDVEGYLHTAGPGIFTITNSLTVNATALNQSRHITSSNAYVFDTNAKLVVKNADEITKKVVVLEPEGEQTITVPNGQLPVVDEEGNAINSLQAYVKKTNNISTLYLAPTPGLMIIVR